MTKAPPKISRINVGHYLIILLREGKKEKIRHVHKIHSKSDKTFEHPIVEAFEPETYFLAKKSDKKNWKTISLFNKNTDKVDKGLPQEVADLLQDSGFIDNACEMNLSGERSKFTLTHEAKNRIQRLLTSRREEWEKAGQVMLKNFMLSEYHFFWPIFSINALKDWNTGGSALVEYSKNEGEMTLYIHFFYALEPAKIGNIGGILKELSRISISSSDDRLTRIAKNEYDQRKGKLEGLLDDQNLNKLLQLQRREIFNLLLKTAAQPVPMRFLASGNRLHSKWSFHSLFRNDIFKEWIKGIDVKDVHILDDLEPLAKEKTDDSDKGEEEYKKKKLIIKIDLRDFKNLFEVNNIRESHRLTQTYLYRIVHLLEMHGGYIIQQAGDSVFAEVEYEAENPELIQDLLRKLLSQPWPIRMGLCIVRDNLIWVLQGPLELKDISVHGKAANIAARLEAKGKGEDAPDDTKVVSRLMVLKDDFKELGLETTLQDFKCAVSQKQKKIPELPGQVEIIVIDAMENNIQKPGETDK